jgi:hypothetical protein
LAFTRTLPLHLAPKPEDDQVLVLAWREMDQAVPGQRREHGIDLGERHRDARRAQYLFTLLLRQ